VIFVRVGGQLRIEAALGEDDPPRRHLAARSERFCRQPWIAIGAEHAIGRIAIRKFGDVDQDGIAAMDAGDAVHRDEAVEQIAFGIAVHVLEQV
jgi:hypothetical protein